MTDTNNSKRRRYTIVNPFRFFVFVLVCSMLSIFAVYAVSGSGKADAASLTKYTMIKIQDDDTLWNIVETYNPDGNVDIRSALYDLYKINDISADSIKPGDELLVPLYT